MPSHTPAAQPPQAAPPGSLRAVLFDAVGTLLAPDPPVAEAYHAAGRRFGSRRTIDEVHALFRTAFQRQEQADAHSRHQTSEAYERRRWQQIVAEVFDDVPDSAPIFASLWQHFAQPQHWRLYDDVVPCLQQLAAAGYLLGIASNFDARLDRICQAHPLLAPCPRFVSSQLGWKKPALEFFRAIEQQLQLPSQQILLVGDDWENDYLAARRAGWHSVFLNRAPASPAPAAACTITSLTALPDLLKTGVL